MLSHNYLFWWLAQVLAVALLIFLFLRWRPGFLAGRTVKEALASALQKREDTIQSQLEAAERSRQEAAVIREKSARDVEEARLQAQHIVSRAEQTSQAIQRDMQERAQQEYDRIVGQAKVEIEYERDQAELALRRRAADIVVDAAGQVIRQDLDPGTDRRIIDQSLDNLRPIR